MKNIATKELNYVKDFLSWELLSAKKCYQYGQQETDPQRRQLFIEAADVHQQNYRNLLNYVQKLNAGQGSMNQMNMGQGGKMN